MGPVAVVTATIKPAGNRSRETKQRPAPPIVWTPCGAPGHSERQRPWPLWEPQVRPPVGPARFARGPGHCCLDGGWTWPPASQSDSVSRARGLQAAGWVSAEGAVAPARGWRRGGQGRAAGGSSLAAPRLAPRPPATLILPRLREPHSRLLSPSSYLPRGFLRSLARAARAALASREAVSAPAAGVSPSEWPLREEPARACDSPGREVAELLWKSAPLRVCSREVTAPASGHARAPAAV